MTFSENIPNDEILDFIVGKSLAVNDNQTIHGYVTIIKNEGKLNEEVIVKNKHNLLTNTGKDYFHDQCYTNTAAGGVGCRFVGLSQDSTSPVVADTDLSAGSGEISTGGLNRQRIVSGRGVFNRCIYGRRQMPSSRWGSSCDRYSFNSR